jgi:phage tail-like protein
MSDERELLLPVFRFTVDFEVDPLDGTASSTKMPLCSGAFAECSGLEATMEPKVIKEGGRNCGPLQRAGPVTFATVVLKRGVTQTRDLWWWFDLVTGQQKYALRLAAIITMYNLQGNAVLAWRLARAMPTKFKASDLNAKGTEVGVEELHLAHEGLSVIPDPEGAIA